ncbi:MAG: tRNA (adenosine(37)-N6)-threonylcarbamoyltransferase complex dimerization subunit type 1 TsaB, partial [Burkholderiales bacterium]
VSAGLEKAQPYARHNHSIARGCRMAAASVATPSFLGRHGVKLLALDTSTELCSVALWLETRMITEDCLAGPRHSEMLLPMVARVLEQAGLSVQDLDGVAFGQGPGSFTGLRVGCGVAQGLAFGANLPALGIGTLRALAQDADSEYVIASLDARLGEVYHAAFRRRGDAWEDIHCAALCRPRQAPEVSGGDWVGVGSGFVVEGGALRDRYAGQLREVREQALPHARAIALLALKEFEHGRGMDATEVAPLYIRNKVARRQDER